MVWFFSRLLQPESESLHFSEIVHRLPGVLLMLSHIPHSVRLHFIPCFLISPIVIDTTSPISTGWIDRRLLKPSSYRPNHDHVGHF